MTTVQAAAQWTGGNFAIGDGDIPHWIVQAMGAADLTFAGIAPEIVVTVKTAGGTATANPTDWVFLADDGLGATTDQDFTENYEIAAS